MKSLGIVRKIDEVGRIVLPKELRDSFQLVNNEDAVEIFVDGDAIILKKYAPSCIFCRSAQEVIEFAGHKVCPKCIDLLNQLGEMRKKR